VAVAFDAVGPAGGAGSSSATSPYSWTHICGAGATDLYVFVTDPQGTTNHITGVTYNSVAMTFLKYQVGGTAAAGGCTLWYLKNPATGSNSVQVTWTAPGTNKSTAGSISFTGGGAQGTVVSNASTGTATSFTVNVGGTTSGGQVVVGASYGNGSGTFTGTNSVTKEFTAVGDNATAADNCVGGNVASAGGTQTVGFSFSGTADNWGMIAVEVQPATPPVSSPLPQQGSQVRHHWYRKHQQFPRTSPPPLITLDPSTPSQAVLTDGAGRQAITSASFSPPANTLIAVAYNQSFATVGPQPTMTFSSTGNTLSWSEPVHVWQSSLTALVSIAYAWNASAQSGITVTATPNATYTGSSDMQVFVLNGAAQTQTGAGTATWNSGATSNSTVENASITTTHTGAVVLASAIGINAGTWTPTGSTATYGPIVNDSTAGNSYAIGTTIGSPVITPGAGTLGWTISPGCFTAGGLLEILPGGPNGSGTVNAGLATATAQAIDNTDGPFGIGISLGLAASTAAALAPGIGITVGLATATGTASGISIVVNAGLASATSTASAPAVGITTGLASGTGAANAPNIGITAGLATGTGTAGGISIVINAGLATATGSASAPAVGLTPVLATATGTAGGISIVVNAGLATGTGAAFAPSTPRTVGLATGTGTASGISIVVNAGLATGTGAALAPSVPRTAGLAASIGAAASPAMGLTPGLATGTGTAGNVSVLAPGISAGLATAVGTAGGISIVVNAGLATGTGSALAPSAPRTAGLATGTGAAFSPGIGITAGLATGTGTALAPSTPRSIGLATGTGTAFAPTTPRTIGLATGTGTAFNPTATVGSRSNVDYRGSTLANPNTLGGTVSIAALDGTLSVTANTLGGTVSIVNTLGGTVSVAALGGTLAVTSDTLTGTLSVAANNLSGTAVEDQMQEVDIILNEFNDATVTFQILNNASPMNITGMTVNALFKKTRGDLDSTGTTKTYSSGGGSPAITINTPSTGSCTLAIPDADVIFPNWTFYRIDVVNGTVTTTAIFGTVTITQL
jgi:hypothetical protein